MSRLRKVSVTELVQRHKPKDGLDGVNGRDGIDGVNGKDGRDGVDGKDGRDGIDGITTIKHVFEPMPTDALDELKKELELLKKRVQGINTTHTSGGGGKLFADVHVVDGDITVGRDDSHIIVTSTATVTLPAKPRNEQHVTIKQGAVGAVVTVEGNGNMIDGDTCQIMAALASDEKVFNRFDLIFTNGVWYI